MATVTWHLYNYAESFNPGESRVLSFSETVEFNWTGKALSVSVRPPVGGGGDRAIEVTQVIFRAETSSGSYRTFVDVIYRNIGVSVIPFYQVTLGIISE